VSNWRINFGLGPLRYNRALKRQRSTQSQQGEQRKMRPLGVIIAIVLALVLVYLCCWGGVAYLSRDL